MKSYEFTEAEITMLRRALTLRGKRTLELLAQARDDDDETMRLHYHAEWMAIGALDAKLLGDD